MEYIFFIAIAVCQFTSFIAIVGLMEKVSVLETLLKEQNNNETGL